MEIRAAVWPDLGCVARCEARAFETPSRALDGDAAQAQTVLAEQIRSGEIYVATRAGVLVGYISFATDYEHLFVNAIAVLPEHQRQGLGSRLLTFAEQTAAQRSLEYVSLFSDGMIAANTRFYSRRGYRETDRCDGPSYLRIYFSKEIVPVTARAA